MTSDKIQSADVTRRGQALFLPQPLPSIGTAQKNMSVHDLHDYFTSQFAFFIFIFFPWIAGTVSLLLAVKGRTSMGSVKFQSESRKKKKKGRCARNCPCTGRPKRLSSSVTWASLTLPVLGGACCFLKKLPENNHTKYKVKTRSNDQPLNGCQVRFYAAVFAAASQNKQATHPAYNLFSILQPVGLRIFPLKLW